MIIGVAGKSGAGKNFFAESLRIINPRLIHVDIDLIGHQTFEIPEVMEKLIMYFGDKILRDGKIDRKAVADLVFTNRHNYDQMAEATWGHMQRLIDEAISDPTQDYILNWILLPHSRYFAMCGITYLVVRDEELRVDGVLERDGITRDALEDRDTNGIKYNPSDFTFVVLNNRRAK